LPIIKASTNHLQILIRCRDHYCTIYKNIDFDGRNDCIEVNSAIPDLVGQNNITFETTFTTKDSSVGGILFGINGESYSPPMSAVSPVSISTTLFESELVSSVTPSTITTGG
jgi:hypothetical protein